MYTILDDSKTINPRFSGIKLNQNESTKSLQFLLKYKSADIHTRQKLTLDLFEIFDKKLQQESFNISKECRSRKDVLQDLYLSFLEGIIESINAKNPLEYIVNKINNFKPSKLTNKTEFGNYSIDKQIPNFKKESGNNTTFASILTKDFGSKLDVSTPNLSAKIEQFYEEKDDIDSILSTKEQQICNMFLSGISLKNISKTLKITETRVREHFLLIISKIKDHYNSFDGRIVESMQTLQEHFKIKEFSSVKNLFVKTPRLQKSETGVVINKIQALSELLDITPGNCVDFLSKYPNLLLIKPKTIQDKIQKSSKLLNIDEKTFKKMGTTIGSLLYAKPEVLKQKIESIAEVLHVSAKSVTDLAKSSPGILTLKASTLNTKIKKMSEILNISEDKCAELYNKFPYLIPRSVKALTLNMSKIRTLLHIDKEIFNKIIIKQPNLIYQSPQTIYNNVKTLSDDLSIRQDKLVKAYVTRPQLFIQRPGTLKKNIEGLSELLGISTEDAIALCLRSPQLFCNSPKTALAHAQKYAELTRQPLQEVIKKGLTQYSIFLNNSDNIVKKQNILSFFSKIRNKEEIKSLRLNTNNDLYASILRYLIKLSGADDFPSSRKIYETTKAYILAHPDKQYLFELPQHSEYNNFVDFCNNLSEELLGKNIFEFKNP